MVLDSAATIGIGGSAVDLPDFWRSNRDSKRRSLSQNTSVFLAERCGQKRSTGVA